jgi:hypothetical protein
MATTLEGTPVILQPCQQFVKGVHLLIERVKCSSITDGTQVFRKQREGARARAEEKKLKARIHTREVEVQRRLEREEIIYVKAQERKQVS